MLSSWISTSEVDAEGREGRDVDRTEAGGDGVSSEIWVSGCGVEGRENDDE